MSSICRLIESMVVTFFDYVCMMQRYIKVFTYTQASKNSQFSSASVAQQNFYRRFRALAG